MSLITQHVVWYAAQECSWQESGEMSVAHMIEGWRYAHRRRNRSPTYEDVLALGRCIEPVKNKNGVRTCGVRVGLDIKMQPELVPRELKILLVNQPPLEEISEDDVTALFKAYEDIHPFIDGNGRTGSLLANWWRGSLSEPVHPPNLWNDPRRSYLGYPEPGPFVVPQYDSIDVL